MNLRNLINEAIDVKNIAKLYHDRYEKDKNISTDELEKFSKRLAPKDNPATDSSKPVRTTNDARKQYVNDLYSAFKYFLKILNGKNFHGNKATKQDYTEAYNNLVVLFNKAKKREFRVDNNLTTKIRTLINQETKNINGGKQKEIATELLKALKTKSYETTNEKLEAERGQTKKQYEMAKKTLDLAKKKKDDIEGKLAGSKRMAELRAKIKQLSLTDKMKIANDQAIKNAERELNELYGKYGEKKLKALHSKLILVERIKRLKLRSKSENVKEAETAQKELAELYNKYGEENLKDLYKNFAEIQKQVAILDRGVAKRMVEAANLSSKYLKQLGFTDAEVREKFGHNIPTDDDIFRLSGKDAEEINKNKAEELKREFIRANKLKRDEKKDVEKLQKLKEIANSKDFTKAEALNFINKEINGNIDAPVRDEENETFAEIEKVLKKYNPTKVDFDKKTFIKQENEDDEIDPSVGDKGFEIDQEETDKYRSELQKDIELLSKMSNRTSAQEAKLEHAKEALNNLKTHPLLKGKSKEDKQAEEDKKEKIEAIKSEIESKQALIKKTTNQIVKDMTSKKVEELEKQLKALTGEDDKPQVGYKKEDLFGKEESKNLVKLLAKTGRLYGNRPKDEEAFSAQDEENVDKTNKKRPEAEKKVEEKLNKLKERVTKDHESGKLSDEKYNKILELISSGKEKRVERVLDKELLKLYPEAKKIINKEDIRHFIKDENGKIVAAKAANAYKLNNNQKLAQELGLPLDSKAAVSKKKYCEVYGIKPVADLKFIADASEKGNVKKNLGLLMKDGKSSDKTAGMLYLVKNGSVETDKFIEIDGEKWNIYCVGFSTARQYGLEGAAVPGISKEEKKKMMDAIYSSSSVVTEEFKFFNY